MSGLLALALDRDVAGHLAVALHRHRSALAELGSAEPEGLAQLEEMALEIARGRHEAPPGDTDIGVPEDGRNERHYLTRRDVHHLTGASFRTIDRWLQDGRLRSTKHGRIRRIARPDLDAFLNAA